MKVPIQKSDTMPGSLVEGSRLPGTIVFSENQWNTHGNFSVEGQSFHVAYYDHGVPPECLYSSDMRQLVIGYGCSSSIYDFASAHSNLIVPKEGGINGPFYEIVAIDKIRTILIFEITVFVYNFIDKTLLTYFCPDIVKDFSHDKDRGVFVVNCDGDLRLEIPLDGRPE